MNFESFKEKLVAALGAAGVDEYEIYCSTESSTSVDTLNREVNSFSSSSGGGICLRVAHSGHVGYAATELMEEEEMVSLVSRAIKNAEATEKEDTVGIYQGGEDYEPLAEQPFTPLSTADLRKTATEIAEKIYSESSKVTDGTASSVMAASVNNYLYNSHGVELKSSCGVNFILAEAVVTDGESSESAYESMAYTSPSDVDLIASRATSSALSKLGATTLPTGVYDLVIDSKRMRTLLSAFASAFSAKNVQMGMSRLGGKVGERIASDLITITDDPMREGAVMKVNFDAEGVPARRKSVVENGVLKTLLHNRETAKQDGTVTTGNASKAGYASPVGIRPYAFVIEPGDKTLDELLRMAEGGILITELKGLHAGANAITGDFSIESSGFRIRNGKPQEAVRSFTVAGNFFELLSSVKALSDTVELGISTSVTTYGAPAALVTGLKVSGK